MNTRWAKSFMAVAEKGSIAGAAKELYISPQALLQQINLLEEEVGLQLVLRKRKGVELTPAGKEFLNGARQMTTLYDRTMNRCRLACMAEDTIRIPVMSGIIIPEFLEQVCARFRKCCDQPKIELISDEQFDFWMDGLQNMKYDVIEHFALDGICPEEIHFEYFSQDKTWCVMPEFHPLAQKAAVQPEDLNGFQVIAPGRNLQLMRYLQMYVEAMGIDVTFEPAENNRYQIMEKMNRGGIYLANESISKIFGGYTRVPLDFDNHVHHGLACRKTTYETYQSFFDVAHEVMDEQHRAE